MMDLDTVNRYIEDMEGKANDDVSAIQGMLGDSDRKLKALKAKLYGKFGKNINLEETPAE
jgi:hypothetical protein